MGNRASDWFHQAQRDFEQARASANEERHEWACFAAQQAAEKAVKALHLKLGQEIWGHVIAKLLVELPSTTPDDLIDKAKVLDNFYIPTRSADGHPSGAPFEHYGRIQSADAVKYAQEILEFVKTQMA